MRWILIDRFFNLRKGESAKGIRCVTRAEEALIDDYPAFPVMPSALLLEMMAQVGGVLVGATINFEKEVVLAKITEGEFFKAVFPPATLEIETRLSDIGDTAASVEGRVTENGIEIARSTIFFGIFESLDGVSGPVVFSKEFMKSFAIRETLSDQT